MKKIIVLLLTFILVFLLAACGTSDQHEGQAKTPSASSVQKGKDYQNVIRDFEEKGFTNIQTEVLYDLITGWLKKDGEVEAVSVEGDKDYKADVWYPNDVEVIVTYHTFSSNKPKTSADSTSENNLNEAPKQEISFSKEYALRAAVVSFTNCFTDNDIFTEDGNDYDISKFKSYADVSGDFMNIKSEGTWSVKGENTWHVEHLLLETYKYRTPINVSLDVSYDGDNYIISNLAGKDPSGNDLSYWNGPEHTDFTIFSIVPHELLKDDRIGSEVAAREEALKKKNLESYLGAMDGLIALSDGIIIEFMTARQDDYSVIHVIVSDAWYYSEEYQKERFAETVAESIERISIETGVVDYVSVYFYDTNNKKLAEPKLFGGYKILR